MTYYDSTMCGNADRVITYHQINALIKDWTGVIIDVRTPKEIKETGSLPCSINIPINELEAALVMPCDEFAKKYNHPKPERYTKIIFTGNCGRRSAQALRIALGLGFVNPYNYTGGWSDWHAREIAQIDANRSEWE